MNNIKRLIRFKVYIDRGRAYIGYVQFIITVTIMLKVYENTSFGIWFFSHWWTFVAFIILFFIGLAVIGFLDKRYVRPHEISEINSTNPEITKILSEIKRLRNEDNQ